LYLCPGSRGVHGCGIGGISGDSYQVIISRAYAVCLGVAEVELCAGTYYILVEHASGDEIAMEQPCAPVIGMAASFD
jgi:hypothetical protein